MSQDSRSFPLQPDQALRYTDAADSQALEFPDRAMPERENMDGDSSARSELREPASGQGIRDGFWPTAGTLLALFGILALGAYLRLTGVNWDSFTHLHPDERFITMVETSLAWPKSLAEYFDTARSTLNPYNRGYNSFVYGTFPLFLVKWLGVQLHMEGYDEIHLVGRVVSALFDLGSVLMVFFIARSLFGRRTALLASLLSALSVIQIQQAHFFTFDTFVAFFLLSAFFFCVRIWQDPKPSDYALLGASLGLAMASKINSALFVLIVAVVVLKELRDVTLATRNNRLGDWFGVFGRFSAATLVGLLVFRIAEPYAFAGPGFFNFGVSQKFLGDMFYVQKLVTGEIDQPPSVSWAGTTPYLFPLRNLVLWGMGPAFGVVAWAGLLFGCFQTWRKRDTKYLLMVLWTGFYFVYEGAQFAKTMRYFLPIVPLLSILAAQTIFSGVDWARSHARDETERYRFLSKIGRIGFPALGAVVVGATLFYAFAFLSIYTRPLTRIAASEWIFANVPQNATIANEHWDDPLPIRWQGRDAGWYRGTMLELYNEDNQDKLNKLLLQLDQTEYIFVSSNRLYGSIPKMPAKYPLTTEYYRLLFSGELGFQLEKQFTSYPQLFGIELNDDSAEEIFTVYDHPKVLIFHKTADYSPTKTRQLLRAIPLDNVIQMKSVEAPYNGLLLSPDREQTEQSGGTWSELYNRAGIANALPTITWWMLLEVLGLLAFPLTWLVFRRLPDRGYGFGKVLGLVVVAYVAWILPSLRLAAFGPGTVLAGMALLLVVAAAILRSRWREILRFVRSNLGLFLAHEVVFLGAFAVFWVIRSNNPDLWHPNFGGEKPMEFAYLNAVAKSTNFPPYDPWFAGGYINYYYFGYVIVASLIRLTGIVPAVAFNLAVPTVYALTAGGLFSVGLNFFASRQISKRVLSLASGLGGLAAFFFVLVAGNLDGLIQRLETLWSFGGSPFRSTIPGLEGIVKTWMGLMAVFFGGKVLPALDFWRSTRLVPTENPSPIMEFPWFTFLYGDLHPHMIAMPITVLAIGLALAIVRQGLDSRESSGVKVAKVRARVHEVREPEPSEGLMVEVITLDDRLSAGYPIAGGEEITAVAERSGWSWWERALSVLVAGLTVGTLQATNSWDFPTYLILLSAAFLVASYWRDQALTIDGIVDAVMSAGLAYVVAQLLFMPYTKSYELFYNGVDPAPAKTPVQYYLIMFGFFLFCICTALIWGIVNDRWHLFRIRGLYERFTGLSRWDRRAELWRTMVKPSPWMEILPWAVAALLLIILFAFFAQQWLIALQLGLCLIALLALFQRNTSPEEMLLALFVGLGAVLTLGVEFVTIKGDIGRMNTVFKFYLQAWFLFGIASAVLVASMLRRWRRDRAGWGSGGRTIWFACAAFLFLGVMIYPWSATPTKVGLRFQPLPPTLDGMAYMKGATMKDQNTDIVLQRDYDAITWMQDHVAGSPVVLEAQIPEYRWGSRVSIYTGLPTVLGWTWHQRQQRGNYGYMIDNRLRDIKTMFETQDQALASSLLKRYDVSLIYVGDLERAYYPAAGLAKFDQMVSSGTLSVAYRSNGVTIYVVKNEGRSPILATTGKTSG